MWYVYGFLFVRCCYKMSCSWHEKKNRTQDHNTNKTELLHVQVKALVSEHQVSKPCSTATRSAKKTCQHSEFDLRKLNQWI